MNASTHTGGEFRDDRRAAGAQRLPAGTLKPLTELDNLRASLAIAITLIGTAAIITAAIVLGTWWAYAIAIPLIATRQHAMFVLVHETAHYRLFAHRGLNDFCGRALGAITGISMCTYRVIHRLHHNHLFGPLDPDVALNGGYPRGRAYLWRKLAIDLTGLTAAKTYGYFFGSPSQNTAADGPLRPLDDTSPALRDAAARDRRTVIATQLLMPALIGAIGGLHALGLYLLLWLLPLATVLQLILRLRAIFEHGAPTDAQSPFQAARTNLPGPLARLTLFPHNVNYHIEHHLYPAVPQYHLRALHRALAARGDLAGANVRSPFDTWRRVHAPRAVGLPG